MFGILQRGLKQGATLTWSLGKIIFPITLIMTILQYTPIFPWMMDKISPLMSALGLSAEAAVPLVIGNFLNLYAGIAAIISFDFAVKEVFIMAVMLSFSHNLILESAVAKKVGVSWWFVVGLRLSLAIFSAWLINAFWSGGQQLASYGFAQPGESDPSGMFSIIWHGVTTAAGSIVQLALIVIPLMVAMQYFREKGWLLRFSNWMAPFMKVLGMKSNTSTTVAAGLTIGLAYGAGVMIQAVEEDGVSKKDMYLTMIFLVSCHAVVEDTLVFIALGIPIWPLLVIRLVTAIVLTAGIGFIWNRRLEKRTSARHSYQGG
ncbi:nucleoside recognition domain-containing protein [Salimicrobium flavidum]|uniref:Nucleoside recognition n=1 Tax=Salimicrobium flavidum TaxID=570947 RepID=A0A1N7J1R9_9BACI|nr:nucleoside recognition domain-containing protein [Salimicrobium flavidum]SIS43224.1 Nucleoside recognition [Salimicrobium flavidum]